MPIKKLTSLYTLLLGLLLALPSTPAAGADVKGWELILDEDGLHSMATSVAVLPDLSILVGGTTMYRLPDNTSTFLGWLKRFDAQGKLIWKRTLHCRLTEVKRIRILKSGDFIVFGPTLKRKGTKCQGSPLTPSATWFGKINPKGETLWSKELDHMKSNEPATFEVLPNGDILSVGYITNYQCKKKAWLCWLGPDGRIKRHVIIGRGKGDFRLYSLAPVADGGFLLNALFAVGEHLKDILSWNLIKVNSKGKIIWERALGARQKMGHSSIIGTSDGGAVIAGSTKRLDPKTGAVPLFLGWLARIDPQGKRLWKKDIPLRDSSGITHSLLRLPNGEFILANGGVGRSLGHSNAALTQLTSQGEVFARVTFTGKAFNTIDALAYSPDGSIITVGFLKRKPNRHYSQWVMKIPVPLSDRK